jgi:signal transduction histidine kinase/CheY-like chemotaxis protein
MFLMFGAFIVSCGFTHFVEVFTFDVPVYRLSALVKVLTVVASWATVLGLVPLVPRALALRSPEELEREIAVRRKAEEALQSAHAELERRVRERTAELAAANAALQAEIVERTKAERERERLLAREQEARAEAEKANRSKDEFLATLSHELRTPLNAMFGWVYLLGGGKLDEATSAHGLEVLGRSTRTLARLIDDLLDVSRVSSGKLRLEWRLTELAPVLEAAAEAVRPTAEARGVALQVELDPAVGPVSGDATRLQQVAWNLLSNAVKFTPRGGRVQLRLARRDGQVEIAVRDDGQGIRPDFLPYVFERFRQGDSTPTRAHGGLGLGLTIVRELVELHGGTVTAGSAGEGQGATFTVRLPLAAAAPDRRGGAGASPSPTSEVTESAGLSGLRVLVVDDEADARDMIAVILTQRGAEVSTAGSVHEALTALDRVRPDVLVSDIGMPGEDGYSLIRQVRARPAERGGRTPAAALTAYARAEERSRALASGFQMHAPKPIDPDELVTVVQALAAWPAGG